MTALSRTSFKIDVDLNHALPEKWIGKVGFNLELFPSGLFGKAFLMDGRSGIFPRQPEGPVTSDGSGIDAKPLATGDTLVVAPGDDTQRLTIHSNTGGAAIDRRAHQREQRMVHRALDGAFGRDEKRDRMDRDAECGSGLENTRR